MSLNKAQRFKEIMIQKSITNNKFRLISKKRIYRKSKSILTLFLLKDKNLTQL